MDNWLLIIVGVIFLISIVAGYVRGLLKIGISLLATVLSIVLVMFLAPYVSDALIKWTPADEMIEEKCMEMFMPQISADTLKNADLSGTSLGELNQDQLADINNLDWNQLGINIQDILNIIGEIPKEVQIQEIENAALPEFLKNRLLENNNSTIYQEDPQGCGVSCYIYPCVDSCQGTDGCSRSDRRASDSGIFQSPGRSGCRSSGGTVDCLALVFDHNIIV